MQKENTPDINIKADLSVLNVLVKAFLSQLEFHSKFEVVALPL